HRVHITFVVLHTVIKHRKLLQVDSVTGKIFAIVNPVKTKLAFYTFDTKPFTCPLFLLRITVLYKKQLVVVAITVVLRLLENEQNGAGFFIAREIIKVGIRMISIIHIAREHALRISKYYGY